MSRVPATLVYLSLAIFIVMLAGCRGDDKEPGPEPDGDSVGIYSFDTPTPFTNVGSLDTPRMVVEPGSDTVHLVYLLNEGANQTVMYSRMEDSEFRSPSSLSQHKGQKRGGGFLASFSRNHIVAYWINVPATSGQLRYMISDDSGQIFNRESRWNERNEARWPCVLNIGEDTTAYFFTHYLDDWELVVNRDFREADEPTIDVAQGPPFHLQGFTDGEEKIWLAYFEGYQNDGGGRIAFLTSTNNGSSFTRRYLFNDMVIRNISSFFRIERTVYDESTVIHVIFTEESPETTMLYYSRSEDDGANFTTPVSVFTSENPLTQSPLLIARGQYVFIATADTEDDGPALRYIISGDCGNSFNTAAIATKNVSSPETLAGVMDYNGNLILAWDDLASNSAVGEQLFCLKGTLMGG